LVPGKCHADDVVKAAGGGIVLGDEERPEEHSYGLRRENRKGADATAPTNIQQAGWYTCQIPKAKRPTPIQARTSCDIAAAFWVIAILSSRRFVE
jgi:hypothetical protein